MIFINIGKLAAIFFLFSCSFVYGMEEVKPKQEKTIFMPTLKQICMPVVLANYDVERIQKAVPTEVLNALGCYATTVSKALLITQLVFTKLNGQQEGRLRRSGKKQLSMHDIVWHPCEGVSFRVYKNYYVNQKKYKNLTLKINNVVSIQRQCFDPKNIKIIDNQYSKLLQYKAKGGECAKIPCIALEKFDTFEKLSCLYTLLVFCNTPIATDKKQLLTGQTAKKVRGNAQDYKIMLKDFGNDELQEILMPRLQLLAHDENEQKNTNSLCILC